MKKEDTFKQKRDRAVGKAIKKCVKAMKKKGYHTGGIGEGIDHSTGKQNCIEFTFDTDYIPSVEFARRIEVDAIQTCLKCINEQNGIAKYLVEFPYPVKCIKISFVTLYPKDGLFAVWNYGDTIEYRKNPTEEIICPSIVIHEETYEEALRILGVE